MKRLHLPLILLSVACSVMSCQVIDRIFNGDVIARVGSDVLYEHQVAELLPKGCSSEDSALIVSRFIDSWATRCLLLGQAERNLSKGDRNIGKELEDLRRDLLTYRYEMKFVDSHLDTVITAQECEAYYSNHPHSFCADTYIVKGRYIRIPSSSPNLGLVRRLYRSDAQDDSDRLDEVCRSSAEKYFRYDDAWVSLAVLAPEFGQTLSWCEEELSHRDFIELQKDGCHCLLYVTARTAPGEPVPFDYCRDKIKMTILEKRKQELVNDLERNLLVDAKKSGLLTVY